MPVTRDPEPVEPKPQPEPVNSAVAADPAVRTSPLVPTPPRPVPNSITKPATGMLRLTVVGGGPLTQILIDGRPSRAITQLPVGTHTVEIRSRGKQPQKLDVEIRASSLTTKRIELGGISQVPPRPTKDVRPAPKRPPRKPAEIADDALLAPGTIRPRK
jgi:hypothetical protein